MLRKPMMTLAFVALGGCAASQEPASPRSAASAAEVAPARARVPAVAEREPEAAPPKQLLTEADLIYDSQWGATRAGRFEVDRQVAELRRAVLLYTQFIERAQGRPEMAQALQKSRERLEDANRTIEFLLQSDPVAPR